MAGRLVGFFSLYLLTRMRRADGAGSRTYIELNLAACPDALFAWQIYIPGWDRSVTDVRKSSFILFIAVVVISVVLSFIWVSCHLDNDRRYHRELVGSALYWILLITLLRLVLFQPLYSIHFAYFKLSRFRVVVVTLYLHNTSSVVLSIFQSVLANFMHHRTL